MSRLTAFSCAILLYIFYKSEYIQSILASKKAFSSNGCGEMFILCFFVFKRQKSNQKDLIVLDVPQIVIKNYIFFSFAKVYSCLWIE